MISGKLLLLVCTAAVAAKLYVSSWYMLHVYSGALKKRLSIKKEHSNNTIVMLAKSKDLITSFLK
jgi:hypothetical protein